MDELKAATCFSALAQESRVRILRLLIAAGPSGMRAGEVQQQIGMPSSTLSFHLSALEQAGLVQSTRQGRTTVYAVRLLGLRQLVTFVTETCCGGRADLCGDIARLFPDLEEERPMTGRFNVLFLCTHNSARSIMAEAVLNRIGGGRFSAYSAGAEPVSAPNADVLANLKQLGFDVASARSKSWDEFTTPDAPQMDFVITLCDTAAGQACPDFGDQVVSAAWPLPDPARFEGSAMERAVLLKALYGIIRRRLETFIRLPFGTLDRMAVKARLDALGFGTTQDA